MSPTPHNMWLPAPVLAICGSVTESSPAMSAWLSSELWSHPRAPLSPWFSVLLLHRELTRGDLRLHPWTGHGMRSGQEEDDDWDRSPWPFYLRSWQLICCCRSACVHGSEQVKLSLKEISRGWGAVARQNQVVAVSRVTRLLGREGEHFLQLSSSSLLCG